MNKVYVVFRTTMDISALPLIEIFSSKEKAQYKIACQIKDYLNFYSLDSEVAQEVKQLLCQENFDEALKTFNECFVYLVKIDLLEREII